MLLKPVIDIEPALLRRSAEAQLHAIAQGVNHMNMEQTGNVSLILKTLVREGPWAWAIMTFPRDDGSIVLPVQTTFEAIEQVYKQIRGHSDIIGTVPFLQVTGAWLSMVEVAATARVKATGEVSEHEMVLVLPVTTGPGITGELCWVHMDRSVLGQDLPLAAPKDARETRKRLVGLHDQFLDALRRGDADGVTAQFSAGCQSAIRDYVTDSGTITSLDGLEGLRDHYRSFFDLYEVQSVSVLHRVVQEWCTFAELRLGVVVRSGAEKGKRLAFHTATLLVPGKEDKFIVQIGHGTDLAPA